jgi:hypothetical protein
MNNRYTSFDQLFPRLRNLGLRAKLPKCEFGANNVQYLGFRLTPEGILPGVDKLKSVRNAEVPKSVKKVSQFIGLCYFCRSHIKLFAKVAAPLYQLLSKESKLKKGPMPEKAIEAFDNLKSARVVSL